jgi:glycosyltransferase involved in cell wall biosynthesis
MKILWFSNAPGNATEYLKDITISGGWLRSLDKALQVKVELHIAFYYPKRNEAFKYLNTIYHPISRKYWKLLALRDIFWKKFYDRQDLPKYLKIIEAIKPDIIHIHGTENPFGCIIGKTDIPVVTSIQGNIIVIQHKYFSGIERKYFNITKPFSNGLKEILLGSNFRRHYRTIIKMRKREERNLLNSEYIIGRTDWNRRIISIQAPNSHYFHGDEILRDSFYQTKWAPHQLKEPIVVHTTMSSGYFKGLETLCQALYELNNIGIEVNWCVAGIKDNDLIVKIVKKKLKNKYPDHGLKLLGNLTEQQLVEKLLEAEIYVMPSHIENSSNSLCEAMLLGMPCIATFAGGTGSIIKDGEEGLMVQDGDPWALAGAILELYRDPIKAQKYGQMARQRALIRHDKENITNGLIGIYQKILDLSSKKTLKVGSELNKEFNS